MDNFGVSRADRISAIENKIERLRKSMYDLALEKHFALGTEDKMLCEKIDKEAVRLQKVIGMAEKLLAEAKAEKQ